LDGSRLRRRVGEAAIHGHGGGQLRGPRCLRREGVEPHALARWSSGRRCTAGGRTGVAHGE
jgi:hypothetical protein